jgi:hypothetical protein
MDKLEHAARKHHDAHGDGRGQRREHQVGRRERAKHGQHHAHTHKPSPGPAGAVIDNQTAAYDLCHAKRLPMR